MSFFRVVPVLAAATLTFAACSPTPAPGTVMLAVSTNLVPGRDFDSGLVLVAANDDQGSAATTQLQPFGVADTAFPWTVAVRASDTSDKKFTARVRIVLVRGGQAIIDDGDVVAVRDLQFDLPAVGELQMAHVSIDWLSMLDPQFQQVKALTQGLDFNGDAFPAVSPKSCTTTFDAAGECVPFAIDAAGAFDRKLEPYDPAQVFGGGNAPSEPESTCFSAAACFSGAQVVTAKLDGTSCKAPVAAAANVAVLTTAASGPEQARCGAGCGDTLDGGQRGAVFDSELLKFESGSLILPKKVCDRFPDGAQLLVSSTCAQKSRTMPLCPETSGAPGRTSTPRQVP